MGFISKLQIHSYILIFFSLTFFNSSLILADSFADFLNQKSIKNQKFSKNLSSKRFQIAENQRQTLLILATADLHGEIDNTIYDVHAKKKRGLLYLSETLQNLRKQFSNSILLDAGDTLQGSPSAFLFGFGLRNWKQSLTVKLMNQLKYDAVVLGNHDLEIKPSQTAKAINQSHFVWLASNLTSKGKQVLPPYHIVIKNKIRIGIVGLTNPAIKLWHNADHLEGLRFEETVKSAKDWLQVLKYQEKVDFTIALLHSGLGEFYDRKHALIRGLFPPNLANHVAMLGYDLVISGHEHRTFPYRLRDKSLNFPTPVLQPGKRAEGVSSALIEFQFQKGKWHVLSIKRQFHRASKVRDSKLVQTFHQDLQRVKSYVNENTLFQLSYIPTLEDFQKCGAMLTRHALKKFQKSDTFSAFAPFSKRAWKKLKVGKVILRRDLFTWLPYDNFPVLMNLYGQQIQKLSEPFKRWKQGRRVQKSAVILPTDFHQEHPVLTPSQLYPIWISNFHFNGGGGLRSLALIHDSQKKLQTSETLRDTIFLFLKTPQTTPCPFLSHAQN